MSIFLAGTNGHEKKRLSFFQLHGVPKRTDQWLVVVCRFVAAIWALLHFYTNSNTPILDSLVSATAAICHVVDALAQSRKLAGLDRFNSHPLNF